MSRSHARGPDSASGTERAIIDIGSNTVRLVIFGGPLRAPRTVFNEKVTAKLGKNVAETGALSDKARLVALNALRRFALLLKARDVRDVRTVATAAAREATNGAEFLRDVARLGFEPRLLSGEEEALYAAWGVQGAFPEARGVVADLGGGSLELVHVRGGACDHGTSLPFGTLRLAALRSGGATPFKQKVRSAIEKSGFECPSGEVLYLVGGSHRALARYAMHTLNWPLDDPHGFTLTAEDALRLCRSLRDASAPSGIPGLSSSRANSLPDTAALLAELIRSIGPAQVVFSSWGLREGVHFAGLHEAVQKQNPLIAGVAEFVEQLGASPAVAAVMAGWTANVCEASDRAEEELRLAATMLALAALKVEPNLRADEAVGWAMRKRWIGIDAEQRAMLAACMLAHGGGDPAGNTSLGRLAAQTKLHQAAVWGAALRLCRRMSGGSPQLLLQSTLSKDDRELVLTIDPSIAELANDALERDLRGLAERLGLTHRIA